MNCCTKLANFITRGVSTLQRIVVNNISKRQSCTQNSMMWTYSILQLHRQYMVVELFGNSYCKADTCMSGSRRSVLRRKDFWNCFYAMERTQYCTQILVWRFRVKDLTFTSWLGMFHSKWGTCMWELLHMFWWRKRNTYCLLLHLHESLLPIKHVLPDGSRLLQLSQLPFHVEQFSHSVHVSCCLCGLLRSRHPLPPKYW